jgi:tetratricopeptide (TPR) repeat protein
MPEIAEAQALLAALTETEEVKAAEEQRQRRLRLQTAYGQAVMWGKGYAAEETKAAFARAAELTERTDDFSARVVALQGQFSAAATAGELRSARELALTLLREAEDAGQLTEASMADNFLGLVAYWHGDFVEARTHYERALAAPDLNHDPHFVGYRALASAHLAAAMWQLGEVERARDLINSAIQCASETGHFGGIADVLFYESWLEVWRDDPVATLSAAETLELVTQEHGIAQYLNEAKLLSGWARGRMNDPVAGAAQVRRGIAALVEQGVRVNLGFYTGLLAELEAETLGAESALVRIGEAFRLSEQVEHRCWLPFLHRLRGEILLKRDPADPAPADEAFRTSMAIAKEQGARSPVLLASLALAKMLQSIGRLAEAHAVLAPALEGFSPTPEMPEIAEAQALLATLAETEEVKAAIAQQQRRGQLQVAYGNALIAARGFGAPETIEAFARARGTAPADAPERLAADFGLWAASYPRGDLPAMRAYAADFLADVAARPNSPEAGIAHRAQGITHYFAGEYVEARHHLERALSLFEPGRDDDLAFRFGVDPGVPPMAYLAFVLWSLGEIDRSLPLIEQMRERLSGLTHAHTLALGAMHATVFELMRGDRSRARANALDLPASCANTICACSARTGSFLRAG